MSDRINLILLEFFVDGVKLDNNLKASIANYKYGKLSVLFKFLDFPPLQVNQDEVPDGQTTLEPVFRSGRSGLFSVPDVTNITPDLLLVDVFVVLNLPDGSERDKMAIGQTKINLTQHFTCITSEAKLCPEKAPVTRSIRESFLIADNSQKFVGVVSLLIRASCFGNMIVQQFKRNYPRKVQDGHQGIVGEARGLQGHPSGGGDRAMGAAVLKENLEKTLPENLSQVLPEGLIDVIANCFSPNSNAIPVGLLESLRQGIVQGVRGVTGATFDSCAIPLQTIPEAASVSDTNSPSPTATATSSSTTAATAATAAAATRSSPSLHQKASRSQPPSTPLPHTLPPLVVRAQYEPKPPTPTGQQIGKMSGYHESAPFGQQPVRRCCSPVQYPSHTAMRVPSMARMHPQSAHMSASADRCGTPIQYPTRFDTQGAGERLFTPPKYPMGQGANKMQPGTYARQSAAMMAREASRSASKQSQKSVVPTNMGAQGGSEACAKTPNQTPPGTASTQRTVFDLSRCSSSTIREELIRAHTGLYGGNEIVLKRNIRDSIRITSDSPQPHETPSEAPPGNTAGGFHERTSNTQIRQHKHHHRHHHHRHRRMYKARSSGKAMKQSQVGPAPPPLRAGLQIAGLPTISPQMEMHMQQMVQRKGGRVQPSGCPLQHLQDRMAAVVANQPKGPGGQFDDSNKFDVIGTELGGMMLRIHVPKSKKVETGEGFQMMSPSPPGRNGYPAISAPNTASQFYRHHRHHHRHHHHHHRHHHHNPGETADAPSPPHSDINVTVPSPDGTMKAHRFMIKDVSGQPPFTKRDVSPGGRRMVADESGGDGAVARRFGGKENSNRRFHAKDDVMRHTHPFLFPTRLFEYKSGDRMQLRRDHFLGRDRKGPGWESERRPMKYVYRDIPSRYAIHADEYNFPGGVVRTMESRPQVARDLGYMIAEAGRAAAMKNIRVAELHPEIQKEAQPPDAESDVYVLKIGTRNDKRPDKKRDSFELKMRAPKKVESEMARPEATGPPFIKLSVPQKNRSKSKGTGSNGSSKRGKRTRRPLRMKDKEKTKKVANIENRHPQNVAA